MWDQNVEYRSVAIQQAQAQGVVGMDRLSDSEAFFAPRRREAVLFVTKTSNDAFGSCCGAGMLHSCELQVIPCVASG